MENTQEINIQENENQYIKRIEEHIINNEIIDEKELQKRRTNFCNDFTLFLYEQYRNKTNDEFIEDLFTNEIWTINLFKNDSIQKIERMNSEELFNIIIKLKRKLYKF